MYSDEKLTMRYSADAAMPEDARRTWGLVGYPLASVYAPLQEWRDAYDMETALAKGTLFRELDKPFLGREV